MDSVTEFTNFIFQNVTQGSQCIAAKSLQDQTPDPLSVPFPLEAPSPMVAISCDTKSSRISDVVLIAILQLGKHYFVRFFPPKLGLASVKFPIIAENHGSDYGNSQLPLRGTFVNVCQTYFKFDSRRQSPGSFGHWLWTA